MVYIGATRQKPSRRWHGGHAYSNNTRLWDAVKLYGWGSFEKEIIATELDAEKAFALEKELISQYDSANPVHGYNIAKGYGRSGCSAGESTRLKISSAITGKRKGIPHSSEHKAHISQALTGHTCSQEARDKLRDALGDRFKSPEAREKQKLNTPRGSAHHKSKAVQCLSTGACFATIAEAAKSYQINRNSITKCCCGAQPTAGGFKWRYLNNEQF